MGLDMYLYKTKKFKDTTFKDVFAIESWQDWLKAQEEGRKYANCSLKEWCGREESDLPSQEVKDFYIALRQDRYASWDANKNYPHTTAVENVGYWRKANQIHKWFVKNVQHGNDDCGTYEVTKEQLKSLWFDCLLILTKDGIDVELAKKILPTTEGFFFGSTEYDEWYQEDIENTIQIIQNILESTDFDTEMIAYSSSW